MWVWTPAKARVVWTLHPLARRDTGLIRIIDPSMSQYEQNSQSEGRAVFPHNHSGAPLMDPICGSAGGRAKHALLRATEAVTPPKPPPPPFFNVTLGENNLARPSLAQESVLSCGGQQIHRGRGSGGGGGGGGEGSAITPQGGLEAIIPQNNPPTAVKNNTHKLFCQPIVLSHRIAAGRVVLTSFTAEPRPRRPRRAGK